MNQTNENEEIQPENQNIFVYSSSPNSIQNNNQQNVNIEESDENINIHEMTNNFQKKSYEQSLDAVQTDIKSLCFPLHEKIESMYQKMIEHQKQELFYIILEFYKDIYYYKLTMDNLDQFSSDLILKIWIEKHQEQVKKYLNFININDGILI